MNVSGNTMLVTGGGSGIGLELATAFKQAGNEVIVAGRSLSKLETAKARGLKVFQVDMMSEDSIRSMAIQLTREFPALNVVVHNAGIMVNEKLTTRDNSKAAYETLATNLLGPIYLTNALLPHFLKQKSATVMTVTSGLAFVPLAMTPTYSASKAAIHSYTQSLRFQLKDTSVEVQELVPPYVRTALMGERQKADSNAMPIEDFISEVMTQLRETPHAAEVLVQRVLAQRTAGFDQAKYDEFFNLQNERLMAIRQKEWDAL